MKTKNYFILVSAMVLAPLASGPDQTTFTKIRTGSIVNDGGASFRCGWGDYDNDGFLDLLVINLGGEKNRLYHNNRDGTFARVTMGPVANDTGDWRGFAWADFDNDGNLDLLGASVGANRSFYRAVSR